MAMSRSSASSSSMSKSALRVTRKRWRLDDLHAGEQVGEVGRDDLVDGHEVGGFDLEQARQDLRHLHPREDALVGVRVAQADGDRQAQRRDVRERVAGIDRERRQDREDLVEEALAQLVVVLGDRRVVDDLDPSASSSSRRRSRKIAECSATSSRMRSRAATSCSAGVRPSGERVTAPASTCWRRPAIRTWKNSSRLPAKMARNSRPLEQRVALVARLVQDARR